MVDNSSLLRYPRVRFLDNVPQMYLHLQQAGELGECMWPAQCSAKALQGSRSQRKFARGLKASGTYPRIRGEAERSRLNKAAVSTSFCVWWLVGPEYCGTKTLIVTEHGGLDIVDPCVEGARYGASWCQKKGRRCGARDEGGSDVGSGARRGSRSILAIKWQQEKCVTTKGKAVPS